MSEVKYFLFKLTSLFCICLKQFCCSGFFVSHGAEEAEKGASSVNNTQLDPLTVGGIVALAKAGLSEYHTHDSGAPSKADGSPVGRFGGSRSAPFHAGWQTFMIFHHLERKWSNLVFFFEAGAVTIKGGMAPGGPKDGQWTPSANPSAPGLPGLVFLKENF